MSEPIPPDTLHLHEIPRSIQRLRQYLTQQRINEAKQAWATRVADGNRFRHLVLAENQPWLEVFDWLDKKTMNGARRLRRRDISPPVLLAALAGHLVDRIRPTLPSALSDHMRARLLDLDGRAHPLLMEWDAAYFYLRRGYHIDWTDCGTSGPELTGRGHGLTFEVECKRITRKSKEKLTDRHALSLGQGTLDAIADAGLFGDIVLDTVQDTGPPGEIVKTMVAAALKNVADPSNLDVQIPSVGHLKGHLSPLGPDCGWATKEDIQRRMSAHPHDHRSFAMAVSHAYAEHPQAIVLWLRGPRYSQQEHIDHIHQVASNAAAQITGNHIGVIIVEVEDVEDVALFRDKSVFRHANQSVFAAQPAIATVIWQGARVLNQDATGFVFSNSRFAERNDMCTFDASALPLMD